MPVERVVRGKGEYHYVNGRRCRGFSFASTEPRKYKLGEAKVESNLTKKISPLKIKV